VSNQKAKEGVATTIDDNEILRPKKGRHATATSFWSYLEYRHVKRSLQAMHPHWVGGSQHRWLMIQKCSMSRADTWKSAYAPRRSIPES
jgi:hypothetical protein